jgi:macrolide transport system ATP-binding/permease protein
VVLIVALGNGSKQKVLKDISSVGTAKLMIVAGDQTGNTADSPRVDSLTLDDMQVLAKQSYITATSPELSANMTAQVANISRSMQVEGASLSQARLQNIELVTGRLFRPNDLTEQQQTVVIDQRVKTVFFPHQSAVGQVLFLNGIPCRVIGVFKVKGYDDNPNTLRLWLPYTTLQTRFIGQSPRLDGINVAIRQGYTSALAVESVTRLLTARHGKKDFTIINSDSIAQAVEKTAKSLTLLVSAIAVISLLVGGIGVMNIMLVSVTERTGEIGVRMAVGASYRDIVQQFLIEAMMVCSVGGVLGVMLAFGLGALLQLANIEVAFSITAVMVAVLCSTLIGLLFGFMPAHRAAKMNPIDALNQG